MAPPVALETPQVGILPKRPQKQHAGTALFNPAKHLSFSPPSKTLQMSDLALEPTPLSNIATTEPFPLLSHDAVLAHRREIFSPDVLDNCMHHTRPGSVQIRGMAPRYAPFIHQFWHSPEVLKIISDVAGVDLVPAMDYEISHANVQLGGGGLEEVRGTPVEPPVATEEAIANFRREKEKEKERETVTDQTKPIIEWHKDSHPFVCVVMLSDARHMAGGETELMKGDGTTLKVKAPQMGCAVLLQGRYITHTAAPVINMPERVTIVTSFRPKSPMRLDVLAERARIAAETLRKRYEGNVKQSDPEGKKGLCRIETVDVAAMQKWADEQIAYIQQTMYEMRPLGQ